MLSSLTQISTGSKMDTFVSDLRSKLSDHSRILTPANPDFAAASERWSDIDRKTPAVIVQPAGEEDIVVIVKAAHAAKIPFVPATGGHSPWSTIENGIIIDLSRFKDVRVDTDQQLVTVKGGVLMKELQIALSESNQFTTVANGNTVGAIPYMIGGGISSYTPLIGYACENIHSARVVVASGDVVVASPTENSDLLWPIRGAGQFFGLVTELVLHTHDHRLMGPNGIRQLGTILFPTERASEVCGVLKDVVSRNDHASAGHFMAMNDP
ncbi:MAG: hypothetical protein L6R40_003702 [Gallowayella cf. fulva]|nr:MAG: hypothetical protein L6R40_003702 [Xanthomendoza cf. fulva]